MDYEFYSVLRFLSMYLCSLIKFLFYFPYLILEMVDPKEKHLLFALNS